MYIPDVSLFGEIKVELSKWSAKRSSVPQKARITKILILNFWERAETYVVKIHRYCICCKAPPLLPIIYKVNNYSEFIVCKTRFMSDITAYLLVYIRWVPQIVNFIEMHRNLAAITDEVNNKYGWKCYYNSLYY